MAKLFRKDSANYSAFGLLTRSRIFSLLALVAIALFASTAVESQTAGKATKSDSTPAGNIDSGKKLFTSYGCYQCHGRAAQGGVGPQLGPDVLPFAVFAGYIRHPSGTGMPPYTEKVASEQDLADIYAFLKTMPQPPKAKNIPLLND